MTENQKYTEEEIFFLKTNHNTMTHKEMAKHLNRTEGAIRSKCFSLCLRRKEEEWSDYEIDILKECYGNKTQKEIGELLGRTRNAVNIKASKLGLKKGYKYNRSYFHEIDTEDKAYWLGFICADGCVKWNPSTGGGELSIELQHSDYQHLQKFVNCLNGNMPIKSRERDHCFEGKYSDRVYKTSFIRIYSTEIATDLQNIGCCQNKTYQLNLPPIEDALMWHFIRGFFDGDGCVCYQSNKKNLRCDFTTVSKGLVDDLRSWLYNHDIHTYVSMDKNKYRLCVAGKKDNLQFLSNIYDNATIFLDRKYEKQKEIRQKVS